MAKVIYKKRVLENEITVVLDEKENFYLLFLNGKGIGGDYNTYSEENYKDFMKHIVTLVDTLLERDNLKLLLIDTKGVTL
jgi:hypothetical protein